MEPSVAAPSVYNGSLQSLSPQKQNPQLLGGLCRASLHLVCSCNKAHKPAFLFSNIVYCGLSVSEGNKGQCMCVHCISFISGAAGQWLLWYMVQPAPAKGRGFFMK